MKRASLLLAFVCVGAIACAPRPSTDVELASSADEEQVDLPDRSARALLIGSALASSGDLVAALPYFRTAHDSDPSDPHLALRFAQTALELGLSRDALAALDRTAALGTLDVELETMRVRLLLGMREQERADILTQELIRRDPDELEFLELRALTLEHLGEPLEALDAYRQLEQRSELSAPQYERMAYLSLHAGDSERASEYARMALRRDPRASGALELLAAALRELSREQEFEEVLRELMEENPQATELHSALADLLLAKGDAEGAVELLLPLAERGDLDRYPQIILVELLMRLDRREEARDLLDSLQSDGRSEPILLRLSGELAAREGDLDGAVELMQRALRAAPDDRETMLSLLMTESQRSPEVFEEDGPPSERRDAFNRLLTRADQMAEEPNLRYDYLIGTMLRRAGRYGEALRRLQRARDQEPDSPEIVYDVAVCLEELERDDETRVVLERLVELAPEEANYLNFLGYFLAERGEELERAESLVRSALEKDPENPFFLDSLGWVYFQTGRIEEAIDPLKQAQEAGLPDDPTVLEHLGDVYRALDDPQAALDHYRRALENGGEQDRLAPRIDAMQELLREGS